MLDNCAACGYSATGMRFFEYSAIEDRAERGRYLCKVCSATLSGRSEAKPGRIRGEEAIQMMAYCTNLLLDAIRKEPPSP